jgi:ring-1,2-phenylacetyl-CoA epoxidase subunit PaaD
VTTSLVREDARVQRAWEVLAQVADPEVPAVSVCDLGIVRDVLIEQGTLQVVLTPTYSGCPATEVIEGSVIAALEAAGLGPIRASTQRAPAWTTDWISEQGRAKLRAYGIAPPCTEARTQEQPIRLLRRGKARGVPACPRCGSANTELVSQFGSTACKALHRCASCREPFEYFKPI